MTDILTAATRRRKQLILRGLHTYAAHLYGHQPSGQDLKEVRQIISDITEELQQTKEADLKEIYGG